MSDNPPSANFRVSGTVILLPVVLSDEGYTALPDILRTEAESCDIFFVEQLRTARRFLRKLIPNFNIDGRTKRDRWIGANKFTLATSSKFLTFILRKLFLQRTPALFMSPNIFKFSSCK